MVEHPELSGWSHVSLSVTDRDRSATFYADVFGFERFESIADERFDEYVLLHRPSGMVLCLQQHHANAGEQADPARTGADHVAFRVATRADLDVWAAVLDELGIAYSSPVDKQYGAVLCLRDPDDFQLELFWREHHP
ncbi:VOC family protein [Pseudonocardia sp. C8]|uniref:VOC family protein n=1 Tax=Pseudonocardia sp. C8 TaxID=2762759 RepID=UPI00164302A5|nr:VOC family protein [Pseudonocardia sp. C8]MBC3193173.1 VOC family protein [Pseudonocardia sp. C8]